MANSAVPRAAPSRGTPRKLKPLSALGSRSSRVGSPPASPPMGLRDGQPTPLASLAPPLAVHHRARPSARARAQRAGVVGKVQVPKSTKGEASGEEVVGGGRRAKRTLSGFPYQSAT